MLISMRILGIDPGLDRTGYGVIEVQNGSDPRLVEAGLVRSNRTDSLPQRLRVIAGELKKLIAQLRPDIMAVEDLYSHYKTPQPAILMGHVRGVLLETAAGADLPVVSYMPTRVKRAVVGQGHAGKEQVARLVQVRLCLSDRQVPADVTDALAVALCHLDRGRRK